VSLVLRVARLGLDVGRHCWAAAVRRFLRSERALEARGSRATRLDAGLRDLGSQKKAQKNSWPSLRRLAGRGDSSVPQNGLWLGLYYSS
jgi:hypothetical protein